MKRMLCSLMLVITMSTTGLLVGSKSASAGPITFAELEQELQSSEWEGTWTWESPAGGWSSGPAKLSLTMTGDNTLYAQISIYESGQGDYTFRVWGTTSGNTMELKKRTSETVLSLSEENGELVLRGNYKIIGGFYAGETGSYYFKKK